MLGSEYNWLIRFTRPVDGAPKIALARSGWFTLIIAVFCFLCVALFGESTQVTPAKKSNSPAVREVLAAAKPL